MIQLLTTCAVLSFLIQNVISTNGHYFFSIEISHAQSLTMPAFQILSQEGIISCSKECVDTTGCTFFVFDDISKMCLRGARGVAAGASSTTIDVTNGVWRVFVLEGEAVDDLVIENKTTSGGNTSSSLVSCSSELLFG